jgi:phage terminase large subunit-like protein
MTTKAKTPRAKEAPTKPAVSQATPARLAEVPVTFSAKLQSYVASVVSGQIAACKWVRLACKRHLRDLERAKTEGFPYRFDLALVERVCRFGSNMRHTKGKWAGEKVTLEPWQIFFLGCIFGWVRKKDGMRRFREVLAVIPRKNGKSLIAAIVGHYMMNADGEKGAEIYSGATSLDQAMEVFRPAWLMVDNDVQFRAHFGLELGGTSKNPGPIYRLSDGSRFAPVIGKPGDGASPSCGIVDEYHEHKTPDLYDTLVTGMGARAQPLLLVVTTAGVDTSVPCYDKQKELEKVLEGSLEKEELFGVVYTIDDDDDWTDFSCWVKANPNFGISIFEDFLRARHQEAMTNPGRKNVLLTKHLNQWQNAGCAWMDMLKWASCEDRKLNISQFAGQECWLGMDLANRIDIAALRVVFRHKKGFAGFGFYYLPADTINRPENAHYQKWREEGWLIETDGAVTDFGRIEEDIKQLCEKFRPRELAYDPKEATFFVLHLQEQPWANFDCVEITQGPQNMSEPMKAFEGHIYGGTYAHAGDPVMNWMMSNVVKKQARGGGPIKTYYPTKERNEAKIDGPVAEIMALSRAIVAVPPPSGELFLDW